MVAVYLASPSERTGKTTIAAAVGKHLLDRKRTVGYFKPRLIAADSQDPDPDAILMRGLLNLEETHETVSPAFPDQTAFLKGIKPAFTAASAGRDVVIVEGPGGIDQTTGDAATALDAKIIGIQTYSQQMPVSVEPYRKLGSRLIGVVVNKVPLSRMERAKAELAGSAVRGLGVIPEDRALLTLTVGELSQAIEGHLVSGHGDSSALVENLLLGAMSPDHGPEYYDHRTNKAVVIRSDRPDMQLAALETSTRCLVLAGKTAPIRMVQRRAEQKGVPIVIAESDTAGVVARLEIALRKTRLNEVKAARAAVITREYLDMDGLLKSLGLL